MSGRKWTVSQSVPNVFVVVDKDRSHHGWTALLYINMFSNIGARLHNYITKKDVLSGNHSKETIIAAAAKELIEMGYD